MNYEKCLPCLQSSKLVFPSYKGVERPIAKYSPLQHVVNRGDWLWSPTNIKQANKDLCGRVHESAQSFVLRSYTMHELRNQHVSIGYFLDTE